MTSRPPTTIRTGLLHALARADECGLNGDAISSTIAFMVHQGVIEPTGGAGLLPYRITARGREEIREKEPPGPATTASVIAYVAETCDIAVADLIGRDRRSTVSNARFLAMLLSRELTGSSLHEIGQDLDGRDHSTIKYGVRRARALIRKDENLRRVHDAVRDWFGR